jgi:hypothetical protein
MTVEAVLQGGPADGTELALIFDGPLPPVYLMMMRSPVADQMEWIICGVGFDDHWPGQCRYDLDVKRLHLMIVGERVSGEAVYVWRDDEAAQ